MTSNEDRLETAWDRQTEHQIIKKRETALFLMQKISDMSQQETYSSFFA